MYFSNTVQWRRKLMDILNDGIEKDTEGYVGHGKLARHLAFYYAIRDFWEWPIATKDEKKRIIDNFHEEHKGVITPDKKISNPLGAYCALRDMYLYSESCPESWSPDKLSTVYNIVREREDRGIMKRVKEEPMITIEGQGILNLDWDSQQDTP